MDNCIQYKIDGTAETIDLRTYLYVHQETSVCFVESVLQVDKVSHTFSNSLHMSGKDIPTFLRSKDFFRLKVKGAYQNCL